MSTDANKNRSDVALGIVLEIGQLFQARKPSLDDMASLTRMVAAELERVERETVERCAAVAYRYKSLYAIAQIIGDELSAPAPKKEQG